MRGRRCELNRVLLGWSTYFRHSTRALAYEAVDRHVHDRVCNFLRKRQKLQGRGTNQASREEHLRETWRAVSSSRAGSAAPWALQRSQSESRMGSSARPV
ncbi:hypothetical protein O7A70_30300 [Mesorhizobium sp. Cs1299R1N1]|uniref:group II intron maturase-specific domain-containing protein n=1 Tax=Mesorhizobium sp. Cs1299R1N1 TaxID=3015172 RepID=UPI00301E53F2